MSLKQKLYEKIKKQPYGTEDVVDIDSIIIPNYMKESVPHKWKLQRADDFLQEHGYIDKPILVQAITNEKGEPNEFILVDQLTRYKALRNNHYAKVPVKYITL